MIHYDTICISLRCRMLHVDRLGIMFYFLSPCVRLSRVSISSGSSWRVAEAKALKASTSLVTKAVAMLRRGRVELQAAPQWIKLALRRRRVFCPKLCLS